jgi:Arc/MetJ-type ribon-helix-helix transcriptional regulator
MVRTQIQLEEEKAEALKRLAAERGVSVSALIRDGIDRVLADEAWERRWRRALEVVGKYHSGVPDLSENHDDYFVEAILDRR